MEEAAAQVAADAHGHFATEVHRGHGEHDLHDREAEHDGAPVADVRVVALQNTVVDDAGVDRRQCQRGRGVHDRQHDDQPQRPLVGSEMGAQQSHQHAAAPTPCKKVCVSSSADQGASASIGCVVDSVSARSKRAAATGSTRISPR